MCVRSGAQCSKAKSIYAHFYFSPQLQIVNNQFAFVVLWICGTIILVDNDANYGTSFWAQIQNVFKFAYFKSVWSAKLMEIESLNESLINEKHIFPVFCQIRGDGFKHPQSCGWHETYFNYKYISDGNTKLVF
jgi:hypothetical protein